MNSRHTVLPLSLLFYLARIVNCRSQLWTSNNELARSWPAACESEGISLLQVRGSRKLLNNQLDTNAEGKHTKPGGRAKKRGTTTRKKKKPRRPRRGDRRGIHSLRIGNPTLTANKSVEAAQEHPRVRTQLVPNLEGAPECPCITNSSPLFPALQANLTATGTSAEYGTMGCKAYDMNNSAVNCETNAHSYCFSPWCYVDPVLCPINEALCHEAGGKVGSMKSPLCRTRQMKAGTLVYTPYSYATCGSLSTYDDEEHRKSLSGRLIRIAVATSIPYLVVKSSPSGELEFTGPHYDFLMSVLASFDTKAVVEIVPQFATNDSIAMFNSSYTACTHDVAVGAIDMCVADIWRTPARSLMTEFTPTLRSDSFYLVVPHKLQEVSIFNRLATPFAPFTAAAWAAVVGFLCAMAFLRWVLGMMFSEYKPIISCKRLVHSIFHDFGHFIYLMFDDFLASASNMEAENITTKFFRLAFAFFVLVIMASYTASLASMLVVHRQSHPEIDDITTAIEQNVALCAPIALKLTLTRLYPQAFFVYSEWLLDSPHQIHNGKCGAAVMSKNAINKMHAGYAHMQDCDLVTLSGKSDEEMRCSKGFNGQPRNDCALKPVGDVLAEVPVAFPVNSAIAHEVEWAFTKQYASGIWEESVAAHANLFPQGQCDAIQRSSEDGLSLADLAGTMMVSFLILCSGIVCHGCVHLCGMEAIEHECDPPSPTVPSHH